MLVNTELDLAALDVLDSLGDVHGDGAGLGVRHESAGTQNLTQTADLAHHVRGCNSSVEVSEASGHLFQQVIGADVVSTCFTGSFSTVSGCEHQDRSGLTGAVREVHGAAHHLVGLAGVDAQTECNFDGRVELRNGGFLGQGYCLVRGVVSVSRDFFGCGPVGL